jgi:hypothetical protein
LWPFMHLRSMVPLGMAGPFVVLDRLWPVANAWSPPRWRLPA